LKFKNLLIFLLLFFSFENLLVAETFQEYKQNGNKNYFIYKSTIKKQFKEYKNAQEIALKEFRGEIKKHWNSPLISAKHTWVEYSKDLKSRKIVDFKKKRIKLAVIAKDKRDARERIVTLFNSLVRENMNMAYKHDILEKKIDKILKKKVSRAVSTKKVIGDSLSKKEKNKMRQELKTKKLSHHIYKNQIIYTISIKLPSDAIIRKAKSFKKEILIASSKQKVPAELIYAIMHSESSFNPMARSNVPAFGLMQIVPRTAGVDAFNYLYGRKKLLSSSYLYASRHNITIGSAYLHILYYRYLGGIKNPISRLYCTISAYNTGSGNVARAFVGTTNIRLAFIKINNMTPKEVYATLINRLPFGETKNYLKIVNKRMYIYKKLLVTF
jgi:membrane-bound lytic murein transglycosylase C